ncbi:radical SAM protein [Enterobacter asburiae]|uniref:radical SAM protein n=1 Tax=Enterobacter asburiae TaxID=61645 RepID=UPI0018C24B92|nr:radical SAM protein [Enterobacter asburiae]MBG0638246.1 radical SAM protein [Enterobacter asburiae]MDS1913638.1 radical SAM protein [Enterobacter asburiae]
MLSGSLSNDKDERLNDLASAFSNKRLHLILLPTEKCNFRCSYCYENFKLGRMKDGVIKGIENLILNRIGDLDEIEIGWFGGEPLLNSSSVIALSNFVKNTINQKGLKCKFKSSMSTNASKLNQSMLAQLVDSGVSTFQISLDGDEVTHNKTRRTATGKGTFENIWRNLLSAKNSSIEFRMALRLHLHKSNLKSMSRLCDMLLSEFEGDARFKIYFKSVEKLSIENDFDNFNYMHGNEKDDALAYFNNKLSGSTLMENGYSVKKISCYASHANSFVIRSNGDIAKCTVDFNNPLNKIGELSENGEMIINNEFFRLWISGYSDLNASTISCPMTYVKRLSIKNESVIKMFSL